MLDWAAVRNLRDKDNPARWRGNLDKLLPAPEKVKKTEHHPAVPIADVGAFMARLRQSEGIAARALEFTILTAARSGETRGATWAEIDLSTATWVVPADRMKAKREHRVPLSDAALALLNGLPRLEGTDLVFPSPTSTAERALPLSDMALTAVMRRMNADAVPHLLGVLLNRHDASRVMSTQQPARSPMQNPRPSTLIIRKSALCSLLGISAATLDRLRQRGEFPPAIRLGEQAIGWTRESIDLWLANRPTVTHSGPPDAAELRPPGFRRTDGGPPLRFGQTAPRPGLLGVRVQPRERAGVLAGLRRPSPLRHWPE